jgi:hypothetical protein
VPTATTRYPTLTPTTAGILLSILGGKPRSFRQDAKVLVGELQPPLQVDGEIPELGGAGWVIVANHYRSPGFRAWWIALTLTATLDEDIRWVMTSAWTYPDAMRDRLLTPATHWVFTRLAAVYHFVSMPPMPPRPWETEARARAVRDVLRYISSADRPRLGLVPEGGDSPDGKLMAPPPGVGRFIGLLLRGRMRLLPAGVFEAEGHLHLRFGAPVSGGAPQDGLPDSRDRQTADLVMRSIASCLPHDLRGPYS